MMRINLTCWLLLIAVLGLMTACGGSGDSTTTPTKPDPQNIGGGGDIVDINPIGLGSTQFVIPGGYTDLRGVASSMQYVYVADATTLYCFTKAGNLVNQVAAPGKIVAVACFPTTPDIEGVDMTAYEFAGFPVILHTPIGNVGYLRIYGPNLDNMTTREDVDNPDAPKFIALPSTAQVNPNYPQDVAGLPQVTAVYDMTVDRFGSILVVADLDFTETTPVPDYRRGLQIFNQFDGYPIEEPSSIPIDPDGPNGPLPPVNTAIPIFAGELDYARGDMGSIGIDTFFPFNRNDVSYTWYTGDYTLTRDFVGVTSISLNTNTYTYDAGAYASNTYGFIRVIGESVGSAPGTFSQNPPLNPDGGLEDQDLSNGGPSGISSDPMTDNVMICDPGNRRIQIFAPDTGAFIRQLGNGERGRSGNTFLAPSKVSMDYEGNIFVCDVNDLRVLREKQPGLHFGSIGGTVSRLDTLQPLEGATVSIGNETGSLGAVATNINGDYMVRYLLTGTYYMTATKFNYDSDTATVQIINDTTVRSDFKLTPRTPATTGSYVGNVIDSVSNLPLPGVTVTVTGTSLTTTSDSLGRFLFTVLAPGTYQVVFSKDGYVTATRDVEILGGQTTTEQLLQLVPIS
jgi:hypothetical protein